MPVRAVPWSEPGLSMEDLVDGSLSDPELGSKRRLGHPSGCVPIADLLHLHSRQLGTSVPLSGEPHTKPSLVPVPDVVGVRTKQPMVWVLAELHVTGVPYHEAFRDRSEEVFVPPSVCVVSDLVGLEPPVPVGPRREQPQVAPVWCRRTVDRRLVPFGRRQLATRRQVHIRVTMDEEPLVMPSTKPPRLHGHGASFHLAGLHAPGT